MTRLRLNDVYREQNRERARFHTKKKRAENEAYHRQCITWATAAIKTKLSEKGEYWRRNYAASAVRKAKNRMSENNWKRHKDRATHDQQKRSRCCYTEQQLYWIKRSRLLSAAKKHHKKLSKQKKMQSESNVCLMDVKLLFAKSEKICE